MSDILVRKGDAHPDLINTCDYLYFEEEQVIYRRNASAIIVTLMENALLTGKVCPQYTLRSESMQGVNAINFLDVATGRNYSPKAIRAYLESLVFPPVESEYHTPTLEMTDDLKLYRSDLASTRVYNPYVLARLKPLPEAPAKWTLNHVRRALANRQFSKLKCDGRYTDDYAFDAAYDYQKGNLHALSFLQKLVEEPSGWRTYANVGTEAIIVHVNCHTFDNNSFTFVLNPDDAATKATTAEPAAMA